MPDAIIRTTVDKLAAQLGPFAGSRHVEVRVLDATEEEARAALRRAVEEADDDPVSLDAGAVFSDIRKALTDKHGLTK
jgi:hypothetical protein